MPIIHRTSVMTAANSSLKSFLQFVCSEVNKFTTLEKKPNSTLPNTIPNCTGVGFCNVFSQLK
jgi:hypothetical protein